MCIQFRRNYDDGGGDDDGNNDGEGNDNDDTNDTDQACNVWDFFFFYFNLLYEIYGALAHIPLQHLKLFLLFYHLLGR